MPKVVNGHSPEPNPDYQATLAILSAYRALWARQCGEMGMDPVKFSRLSLVALTQLASIVGVDIGMQEAQFLAICQANFKLSHSKAPKFGD